ncbi:MAG: ABC transporter ATP-binding protein [Myxococcales bacterium]|nr:ABC transporter ATP-binding protein [Myxococcales bacterium]MCB9642328.1 ABC transporter ATP-binding protein [Myxococcales bacterium]
MQTGQAISHHHPTQKAFLEFRDVHKSFGKLQVLKGINLTVHQGETVSLVGNSGTGKSILVKMLVGLLRPDQGDVLIEGQRVNDLRESEWMPVRKRVSMVFQANALFDSLTVYENLAYPLRENDNLPEEEIASRVSRVLSDVKLPGIEKQYPSELSGGMRKRIGFARAIITQPECVLYDEPTAGLDPISTTVIDRMIRRFQRDLGVTSIVITHDLKSAMSVGDRVALLHDGLVWAAAPPEDLLVDPDPVVQGFFEGYRMMKEILG